MHLSHLYREKTNECFFVDFCCAMERPSRELYFDRKDPWFYSEHRKVTDVQKWLVFFLSSLGMQCAFLSRVSPCTFGSEYTQPQSSLWTPSAFYCRIYGELGVGKDNEDGKATLQIEPDLENIIVKMSHFERAFEEVRTEQKEVLHEIRASGQYACVLLLSASYSMSIRRAV